MTMDKKQYIDQAPSVSAVSCQQQPDAFDPRYPNEHDVGWKFESMEELIQTEISAFRVEVSEKYNFLSNASFAQDTDLWEAANHIPFFTVAGRFLYFNDNFYSEKKNLAAVVIEGTRRALRLKKATVKQLNVNLVDRPKGELPLKDGTSTWPTFYVCFKYKCVKAGTLKVGFEGKPLFLAEEISATEGFETKKFSAVWDGTGDFQISFTGDIYIYSMSLIDHPLANYRIENETRLYQLAQQIGQWAKKTDQIETSVALLHLDLKTLAEQLNSYAKKTDALVQTVTNLGDPLEVLESSLHLCATQIHALAESIAQLKSID